jgi:dTDP-4-amino-4,6-dideoxygalactose transaminase
MIPHNKWTNDYTYEREVLRVVRSGFVGQGQRVREFEEALADRFRPRGEALCVSSGTAALKLAIDLLKEYYGGKVIVPTYACAAFVHAAGETTGLVDCDPEDFGNASMATVGQHTFGASSSSPCIIEDFTHAPGGKADGKVCGSQGQMSVISFGATKPLGIGAGGAVLSDSTTINYLRKKRDGLDRRGFNWQMSDVHAAIGIARLGRLDEENARRTEIMNTYFYARPISWQRPTWGRDRVYYRAVLRLREGQVEKAKEFLKQRGVETIVPVRFDELLHVWLGQPEGLFPNAEKVSRTTLSIPIWAGMTKEQESRVADALFEMGDIE